MIKRLLCKLLGHKTILIHISLPSGRGKTEIILTTATENYTAALDSKGVSCDFIKCVRCGDEKVEESISFEEAMRRVNLSGYINQIKSNLSKRCGKEL